MRWIPLPRPRRAAPAPAHDAGRDAACACHECREARRWLQRLADLDRPGTAAQAARAPRAERVTAPAA